MSATCQHLPRLFQIQKRRTESINVAIARMEHTMIDEQPAFRSLYGHWTCPNLHALPCALFELSRCHHVTMTSPKFEIGRFAIENVTESSVSRVGRTRKHGKTTIDFLGEEHTIAVVGQEGILQLVEGHKVIGPSQANSRSVMIVAPRHIVAAINLSHTRVVAIAPLCHFGSCTFKLDGIGIHVPLQAIFGESHMKSHAAVLVVHAEHTCITVFERNYSRVENTVAVGQEITRNHGVCRKSPQNIIARFGTILPGHIGERCSNYGQFVIHYDSLFCISFIFFVVKG